MKMRLPSKILIDFIYYVFFIALSLTAFLYGNAASNYYYFKKIDIYNIINIKWNLIFIIYFLIQHFTIRILINKILINKKYSGLIALVSELPFFIIFFYNHSLFSNIRFSAKNLLGPSKYITGFAVLSALFLKLICFVIVILKNYKNYTNKNNFDIFKNKIIYSIFIFSILFFTVTAFWVELYGEHGDEWLYLLTAKTTLLDFDFNASNNLEKRYQINNGTLLIYGEYGDKDYKVYSRYSPGIAVFISPLFYVFNHLKDSSFFKIYSSFGPNYYSLIYGLSARIMIGIYTSLALYCFCILAFKITGSYIKSLFITLLSFFTLPVAVYSNQIYSQNIVLFIIIYVVFMLRQINDKNKLDIYYIAFISILISSLFWLHFKFLIVSFIVLLYINYCAYKEKQKSLYYINIIYLISLIMFGLYNHSLFGNILPLNIFHGDLDLHNTSVNSGFNIAPLNLILKNIYGIIFDMENGLLIFCPLLIFFPYALFCHFKNYKNYKKFTISPLSLILIIVTIYFLMIISQNNVGWRGASSPPLRYFVFTIPLLYLFVINYIKFRKIYFLFVIYSTVLYFTGIYLIQFLNNNMNGKNFIIEIFMKLKIY